MIVIASNGMEPMDYNTGEKRTSKGALFISFIVGIVVGVGGYWSVDEKGFLGDFLAQREEVGEGVETSQENGGGDTVGDILKNARQAEQTAGLVQPAVVSENNALVVTNQSAGNTVLVSLVSLEQSGWVAVHEQTPEGNLGNILGARRFDAGKQFGQSIALLRGTEAGKVYQVVLHADDADNVFDFRLELPVTTAGGEGIAAVFTATAVEEVAY
ncbi:MAG: hypothetical protein HY455_01690 [Parcubacteria group bacterium]|nr:hypothetical protein [Parcubacteria group bacterium]